MPPHPYPTITDIDFAALYREHMAAVGRPKPPEVWDARADAMNEREGASAYTNAFVQRMDFSGCESLLDVGCGTGNIALAAAPHLKRIHGLDYSPRMLALFMQNAQQQGVPEAHAILRSWDDDWDDVPECDIVVASRSTAVRDMARALSLLHAKARKRVYLSSLVGGQFGDAKLLQIVGRPAPQPWPDYIYILTILHGMGIHARLDHIPPGAPTASVHSLDDALRHVASRIGPLTEPEQARLAAWWHAPTTHHADLTAPALWALVHWDKPA